MILDSIKLLLFSFIILGCSPKGEIILQDKPMVTVSVGTSEYLLQEDAGGIDSRGLELSYSSKDEKFRFKFFIGNAISDLNEIDPYVVGEKEKYEKFLINNYEQKTGRRLIYVPFGESYDIDYYKIQNVRFDSINGRLCKFIRPREGRIGLYAVHFYSLYSDRTLGDVKMSILGRDLSEEQEEELLRLANSVTVKRSSQNPTDQ